MDAERAQRRHRAPGRRTEAQHGGPQTAAVVAGRPGELEGVQHRGVPGQFVVLVEHVQVERAVVGPVVHRLEGDQGQPPVDRDLGEPLVLDAVRPAPENLPLAEIDEFGRERLGQQHDIAFGEELLPRAEAADHGRQVRVGDAEALRVTVFKKDAPLEVGVDPLEV